MTPQRRDQWPCDDGGDASAGVGRAPDRRVGENGDATEVGSPESPPARKSAAADVEHGGGDSGPARSAQHAAFGEVREKATTNLSVPVDFAT